MDTFNINFSSYYSNSDLFLQYPNLTYNSTEYDDPVVKFFYIITSDTAVHYILVGIYIILFFLFLMPLITLILFMSINYGGSLLIYFIWKNIFRRDDDTTRQTILNWWYWVSKIWFDYEIVGLESVPPDEPLLCVGTHGILPAAVGCAAAICAKYRPNTSYGIIDKHHAKISCFSGFLKLFNWGDYSREECVKFLQEGSDVVITPGGSYEARRADSNYNIDWGDRRGFAEIAKKARVTIIPTFCVNLNEVCWTPFFLIPFIRGRFAIKGFFFAWGCLPVKLITIAGKPVLWDESKTVDDIAEECLRNIRQIRDANQRLPGNKFYALLDRFRNIKPVTYLSDKSSDKSVFLNV